jgi:hypothetical protein
MTKQKVLMCVGLLIAALIVCGCMNMSASVIAPVSHSNEYVAFKGIVSSVTIRPHFSAINHHPAYVVSGRTGGMDFVIGDLGDGPIVIRDPILKGKLEDLRNNPGRYCEIKVGQVAGTKNWEVTEIIISA